MVPVSDGLNIAVVRSGLASASAVDVDAAPHVAAYRGWLLGDPAGIGDLAAAAASAMGSPADRSAWHVAVLGFAAASGRLVEPLRPAFEDGVRWLAERPWHRPLRPLTLEADGVSMLGIALGALQADLVAAARPLGEAAVQSGALEGLSAFNRSLMAAASHLLDAPGRPDLSTMLPEARIALADLRVLPDDVTCHSQAWRNATRLVPGEGGPAHAALALRAFDALCERNMPARLGRLEPDDVVRVLQGVVRSMRLWTWEDKPRTPNSPTVRWDIENEYHVQNLLWAAMAPLFPDLDAEVYTTPVGQKNPRMDLTLPSMGLVVEVKFLRPGASFAKIVEEVAADASLYKADPRWQVLIPFLWDDSGRTEEHAKLIDGLRKLDMVHDAVVMPRPGRMERVVGAAKAARPARTRSRPPGAKARWDGVADP